MCVYEILSLRSISGKKITKFMQTHAIFFDVGWGGE